MSQEKRAASGRQKPGKCRLMACKRQLATGGDGGVIRKALHFMSRRQETAYCKIRRARHYSGPVCDGDAGGGRLRLSDISTYRLACPASTTESGWHHWSWANFLRRQSDQQWLCLPSRLRHTRPTPASTSVLAGAKRLFSSNRSSRFPGAGTPRYQPQLCQTADGVLQPSAESQLRLSSNGVLQHQLVHASLGIMNTPTFPQRSPARLTTFVTNRGDQ